MDEKIQNKGILEILNKLEDTDVIGLASTVTQGLLKKKIYNRKSAVEAILKHSPDELSILRRKCITREILFEYVHENDIKINIPATKQDLIENILSVWGVTNQKYGTTVAENNSSINKSPENSEKSNNSQVSNDSSINTMAEQFSAWFYSLLNQPYPIGEEHFWSDSNITIEFLMESENQTQSAEGDTSEIVNLLFRLRQEHNLTFNPNLLKDGVQGRIDPHGLVVVLACGTLHVNSDCVGVFEQVFMLARDPRSENNWKIKKTKLVLRQKSVNITPRLCDSNLTNSLLQLPSS